MSVTCKGKGDKFTVNNPSLGSAVESWTALMHTLASATPEWWTNVNVDMSDYSNGTSADTGMDALGAGVPVATVTACQGEDENENNGPIVDLQAMECSSTPCTDQDETVYGTAESRPLSDDDTDDGL
jgi:hypothetical protein